MMILRLLLLVQVTSVICSRDDQRRGGLNKHGFKHHKKYDSIDTLNAITDMLDDKERESYHDGKGKRPDSKNSFLGSSDEMRNSESKIDESQTSALGTDRQRNSRPYGKENDIKQSVDDDREEDRIRKELKDELLSVREKEKKKNDKKSRKSHGVKTKDNANESIDEVLKALKNELSEIRDRRQLRQSIEDEIRNKTNVRNATVVNNEATDEIRKRLKDELKRLGDRDEQKQLKFITLTFLKMCTYDYDNATILLKHFLAQAEDLQNSSKKTEIPLVPDFKGNNSAKSDFYRQLTSDQNYALFENDLVNSMCKAAKLFLVESKSHMDRVFPAKNIVPTPSLKLSTPGNVTKTNEAP